MSDEPATSPEQDAPEEDAPEEDVAEANRRRMREALDRKHGVNHPDDRAPGGSGVRGTLPPAAGRDFTRRKSG